MRRFLSGLSWSALGGILGAGLLFVAGILAGRLLGPAEFGRAAQVIFLAQLYLLVATLGFDIAGLRTVPAATDPVRRRSLLSTATLAGMLSVLMCSATLLVAALVRGESLSPTHGGLVAVALLGGVLGWRSILERQTSAVRRFRPQALWKCLEGVLAVGVLVLAMAVARDHDAWTYVGTLSLAALVVAAGLAWTLRRDFSFRAVSRESLNELAPFARLSVLHALMPVGYLYGDKIAVEHALGDRELGIYFAAFTSSYIVVAQVVLIVTNVLFPSVAAMTDKRPVVAKLRHLRRLASGPVFLALWLELWIVLALFGSEFDTPLLTMALFAAWGTAFFNNALVTVVTISHSRTTYVGTVVAQGVRSLAYAGYLVALVASGELTTQLVVLGLLIGELFDGAVLSWLVRRYVERVEPPAVASAPT